MVASDHPELVVVVEDRDRVAHPTGPDHIATSHRMDGGRTLAAGKLGEHGLLHVTVSIVAQLVVVVVLMGGIFANSTPFRHQPGSGSSRAKSAGSDVANTARPIEASISWLRMC